MDISIRTAQHVNIVYQPAGLVNRIGATLIEYTYSVSPWLPSVVFSGTPRQPLSYWSF